MARVPSVVPSLSPQVTLRQDAIPGLRLDAPAGAFGGESASAVRGVGRELEQAGDRIFNRAVALQQLDEEAAARDATTEYILQSGKTWEEFQNLQGKDAPASYEDYQSSLKTSREKIRGTLKTPIAQKMYDAQTQSIMARTVVYGAGHAGRENRKYQVQSGQARINAAANEVAAHPLDDRLFETARVNTKREVNNLVGPTGWDADQLKEEQRKAESKLLSTRVTSIARTDPVTAEQLLAANKDKFTADDLLKVDQTVRTQSRAIYSADIAQRVIAGGQGDATNAPKTLAQMEAEAEAEAKKAFPNDPVLAKNARTATQTLWNQQKYAARQENIENLNTVDEGIYAGVKTEKELLANPRVAAAFEALSPNQRLAVPGKINRYNAQRDMVTNQQNFDRLWGLSNRDVATFLDTDLTSQQLSHADQHKLQKRKEEITKRYQDDPRVARAMGYLRGYMPATMRELGVYSAGANEKNAETYDRFVGMLHQALDVWQEQNKKPASSKDITETIGPELIRKITEPRNFMWTGDLFGNAQVPQFNRTIPPKWIEETQAALKAAGYPEATPAELRRAHDRQLFMNLYGKKKPAQ